jgi:hypothetical protein
MIRFFSAALFMLSMMHAAARGREPGAASGKAFPVSAATAAIQSASNHPAAADSLNIPRKIGAAKDSAARGNFLQLDEIRIQGEVERPSVIVLPKRIEPEMQADSLNRSFSQEIRKNTDEVPTPVKALNRVEPVKSIKKEIEKKRK